MMCRYCVKLCEYMIYQFVSKFSCTYSLALVLSSWQTSIASPFVSQQHMSALLAQQQSMIMAAAAAQNIQAAASMQGQNQASSNDKSGVGSLLGSAFGQQWPATDLQVLGGLVSKPAVQNGGLTFLQVE